MIRTSEKKIVSLDEYGAPLSTEMYFLASTLSPCSSHTFAPPFSREFIAAP